MAVFPMPREYEIVQRASRDWNEPGPYSALRLGGTIANDVAADLDLAVPPRCRVQLSVLVPDALPRIEASPTGDLGELLTQPWPKGSFEEYAIARGFL
jgi:hypothetical protein